jgi:hypothetical protein
MPLYPIITIDTMHISSKKAPVSPMFLPLLPSKPVGSLLSLFKNNYYSKVYG